MTTCRAAPGMWQPKHALGARIEMALGVARGMAAMEAARPPLLHRDLKPTNIFIGASSIQSSAVDVLLSGGVSTVPAAAA